MRTRRNTRWETVDKSNIPLAKLIGYFETYNKSEGKSLKTVSWYNEALSIFLNWLYHEGYTEEHLLQDIRPPRLPEVLVETLSDEEIGLLFQELDQSAMLGSRNAAILALFLDSGIRLSELASLKLHDIHLEEQYVKVMGKGSKERIVSFGNTAQKALLSYLIHFPGEPAHSGVEEFFLTLDGYGMSQHTIKCMLQRLGKAAGVPRLHAHLCSVQKDAKKCNGVTKQ